MCIPCITVCVRSHWVYFGIHTWPGARICVFRSREWSIYNSVDGEGIVWRITGWVIYSGDVRVHNVLIRRAGHLWPKYCLYSSILWNTVLSVSAMLLTLATMLFYPLLPSQFKWKGLYWHGKHVYIAKTNIKTINVKIISKHYTHKSFKGIKAFQMLYFLAMYSFLTMCT